MKNYPDFNLPGWWRLDGHARKGTVVGWPTPDTASADLSKAVWMTRGIVRDIRRNGTGVDVRIQRINLDAIKGCLLVYDEACECHTLSGPGGEPDLCCNCGNEYYFHVGVLKRCSRCAERWGVPKGCLRIWHEVPA